MDTGAAFARFEGALNDQLMLAGGDAETEAMARALLVALKPAARQFAMELAEQAAAEMDAQLPRHRVEVVLKGGELSLAVRLEEGASEQEEVEVEVDDVEAFKERVEREARRRTFEEMSRAQDEEARVTLRMPSGLKSVIDEAARSAGDSVNSYLVKTLSGMSAGLGGPERHGRPRHPGRPGRRVRGTMKT